MARKTLLTTKKARKWPAALLSVTAVGAMVAPVAIAASCTPTDIISFDDAEIRAAARATKIIASETFSGTLPTKTGADGWTATPPPATPFSTITSVHWNSAPIIPAQWADTFDRFEFLAGAYSSAEVARASTAWTAILPTSFAASDFLWARPVLRAGYTNRIEPSISQFEYQFGGLYDLTESSGLKALANTTPQITLPETKEYDLNAPLVTTTTPARSWASYISEPASATLFVKNQEFFAVYKVGEPHVANRTYLNSVTPKTTTTDGVTTTTRVAEVDPVGPSNILFRLLTLRVEYLFGSDFDTIAKAQAATTWSSSLPGRIVNPAPVYSTDVNTWNKATAPAFIPTYYVYARVVPINGITFTNNIIDLTAKFDIKAKLIAFLPDAPKPAPTENPAA